MSEEQRLRRMTVKGLVLDSHTEMPIVILRDEENDGGRFLPIWIGLYEANAIALGLEGLAPSRPMTHDLLANMVEALNAEVVKIVISHLEKSTFHACIELRQDGRLLELDARPSDSIAIALRTRSPIYVSEEVLECAGSASPRSEENVKRWLEQLDPEELGKYTM